MQSPTTMTGSEVMNLLLFWQDLPLVRQAFSADDLHDIPADNLQLMHDYYEGIFVHQFILDALKKLILSKRTQKCGKCKKIKSQKEFYSSDRDKVLKTCASCLDEKRWRAGRSRSYKIWREHTPTKYNTIPYYPRPTPEYCEELKKIRTILHLEQSYPVN